MEDKHIYLSKQYFNTIIQNIKDYCERSKKWIAEDMRDGQKCAYTLEDVFKLELYVGKVVAEFSTMNEVSYQEWFDLCHKYIEVANVRCEQFVSDELQTLWHNGCDYFDIDETELHLCDCDNFVKKLKRKDKRIKEIIEKIKKCKEDYYKKIELSNDILVYRDINALLDKDHRVAFTLDVADELVIFDIMWDWWYPIDRYLDSIHIE